MGEARCGSPRSAGAGLATPAPISFSRGPWSTDPASGTRHHLSTRYRVSSELINTLLILGAAQGLFLAVLLATKRTNATANRMLALEMVAFAVFILEGVYYARAYHYRWPRFIGVSVPLIFLFGPLHYLYARTVSLGGSSFRRASLLHFLPPALVALYLAPFYLQGGASKIAFVESLSRAGPPIDLAIIQQLQYPQGVLYVILTILLLRRHRARLRDNFSSLEHINLLWLRNLTIGIALVWALATGLNFVDLAGHPIGEIESKLTPLAVSCLVYAVGYLGLRQPEIFHGPPAPRTGPHPVPATSVEVRETPFESSGAEPEGSPTPGADGSAGYEKSGLTPAEAAALMQQLRRVMEENQLYLKSQLTLQELAQEMGISAHNLSEVINTQAGKNFYDFVNSYRVEEVMRRLRDPRYTHLTILAVAADSGFNSKATFNAFFKRQTGLTPSQYRAGQAVGA